MKTRPYILVLSLVVVCGLLINCTGKAERTVKDPGVHLPPAWAFGLLYGSYTDQQGTVDRVDIILKHDYPIDGYWIDSWFWDYAHQGKGPDKFIDFVADTIAYPNRKAMWSYLHNHHIHGGFWTWDCILKNGNEKAFNDFKDKGFFKNIYTEKGSWHNNSTTTAMFESGGSDRKGSLCGNINFSDSCAANYFQQRMQHFFAEGADFIKLDRTSDPIVCKAMYDLTRKQAGNRGFILSHTGGIDRNEYKQYPAKWTDDTRSDWNIDRPTKKFNSWVPRVAFKENIEMFLDSTKTSSGIPFLTNDMGGFDMGKTNVLDEELYIRWMEFSMFCPITETFAQPENKTSNMAYNISARADSLFRIYSHLRMRLFPYIYSYAHLVRIDNVAMMRKISGHKHEFLFGDECLVAPVFEQHATTRKVFLPKGEWIDYYTGKKLDGGQNYTVQSPVDKIPLFVKQGSIIPMRNYSSSIEKGTNDTLNVALYLGANATFRLIEDDGRTDDYLQGKLSETLLKLDKQRNQYHFTIEPVKGQYQGMNPNRVWKIALPHLCQTIHSILLNGQKQFFHQSGKTILLKAFASDKHTKNEIIINL